MSALVVTVCASDAGYAMPLAVTLRSAARSLSPARRLRAYVIDDGLGASLRARVAASLPPCVDLRWIAGDRSTVPLLPTWGRMSRTTFQRLLVADLLPREERRALWLDCDVIVESDLGRLWDVPMDGHLLLAAQDMAVPFVSSRLGLADHRTRGIPPDAPYLNAGVMIADLDAWRTRDVTGQVVEDLARRRSPPLFWDQDGLNAVLHADWGAVDPRWNVNAGLAGRPYWRPGHLDPATVRSLVDDPWILHFCGRLKPWRMPDNGDAARRRWYAHLDGTPWAGWRPAPTPSRRLVAAYESSRLRRIVHPMEARGFEAMAVISRARRS